jgi:acetyl esterase/lipase
LTAAHVFQPARCSYQGNDCRRSLWHTTVDPRLPTLAIVNYLTPQFPPSFISVGDADPLAAQSYVLAHDLARLGVRVDTLFFPAAYAPPQPHEYQFNLDTEAARLALQRSTEFLATLR